MSSKLLLLVVVIVNNSNNISFYYFLLGSREGDGETEERFNATGREEIYFSSMTAHIFLYVLPRLWSKFCFGLIKIW